MSLLFAERPLVINTQLAMKIGLNEAIVLQQLHYWLRDTNSGMECDGVRWIYNTTEQWLEQFPFWSESTLKRAFASLKTLGLLRCEKLNKSKRDMTNFYTINYGSELLDGGKLSESIGSKCAAPSGQNDTMEEVKMKRSIGSKRPNVIGSKWPDDLTENTTEITTENKNTFRPEASQPDPQTTEQDFLTRNSDAVVFSAKKRQWGSREDLACAQWIWGRIVGLYEQAASDDGEIMRPKEPTRTRPLEEMTNPHCDHPGHTSRYALFSPFSDPVPVPLPVCHQCEPCGCSLHNGTGHHSPVSLTGSTRQPSWRVRPGSVRHPGGQRFHSDDTVADVRSIFPLTRGQVSPS